LYFATTNPLGDSIHFWLYHDTTLSTNATKVYSSSNVSSIAYASNKNPDAMLFETKNPDGSTWSRTYYNKGIPIGGVYCTNEAGDTVQYYYHSSQHRGQIVFRVWRASEGHPALYSGNPIYSVSIEKDKAFSGDSIFADVEICYPLWSQWNTYLSESMAGDLDSLVHTAIIHSANSATFLLVPESVGIHNYDLVVDFRSGNKLDQFTRSFKISVAP